MANSKNNDKIVEFLKKQEWPVTTEEVAKQVKISWHTAQVNLLKLVAEQKVKYKKVGRQNQFWLIKGYKENF
ncbi:MAG TPA: FaeA/PapI family transcriptional regulator [Candidatus Nanoarchaeia archaeon]|nr:FaeA/PapI family transcriptional regulator [Candidatus Nanoarchaeia archaeon]